MKRLFALMIGCACSLLVGCGGGVVSTTRPEITSFTPTGGFLGSTVAVVVTGRNFQQGATMEVGPDPGISVDQVQVASATRMNVTLAIAADATQARRNLTVVNPNGERHTFEASFGVNGLSPVTVTAVAPANGGRGGSFNVTITGTNFEPGATVTSSTGLSFSNVNVTSTTQLTAVVTIAPNAVSGTYSITVSNPNGFGNSCLNCFTVTQ